MDYCKVTLIVTSGVDRGEIRGINGSMGMTWVIPFHTLSYRKRIFRITFMEKSGFVPPIEKSYLHY